MGTAQTRRWWAEYRCAANTPLETGLTLFGLNTGGCAIPAYYPFKALESALLHSGYRNVKTAWVERKCPTGIGGRTCQPDGSSCSLHNYLIAVDLDPFSQGNPYFKKPYGSGWNFSNCKITRAQVEAVEAIRNTAGEQMFRWLGWLIGDTMHFELQVPPTRTEVDWDTIPGGLGGPAMFAVRGDKGPIVEYWQRRLVRLGEDITFTGGPPHGIDAVYGGKVSAAIARQVPGANGDTLGPYETEYLDAKLAGDGSQGPPGPAGPQGPQGATGAKGAGGSKGNTGAKGADGSLTVRGAVEL